MISCLLQLIKILSRRNLGNTEIMSYTSFTIGYRKASLMSIFLHSGTPYSGLIPQPLKSIQLLLGRAIPDKVQSLALIEFLILLFLIRKIFKDFTIDNLPLPGH